MTPPIPVSIPRGALITGGIVPYGGALARHLARSGFAVALQCHPDDPTSEGVALLAADLGDEAETETLMDRATAAVGPIGVLINGATVARRDSWDEATRTTWDMHIETNLRVPFVLIQAFARRLPADAEGVAINLLDQRLNPRLVSYTLSKAALWTLTQTLALALAPRIRVNGIAPSRDIPAENEADADNVARAAITILALRSMTGQMIVPDGIPPPASGSQVRPGPEK